MNKVFHIYKRGERLCNIAKQYNTTPFDILKQNNITYFDYLYDGMILQIPINSTCSEYEQLYCNEEKRGCYGCYYIE